ncbi:WXG100 family type VII secretion target [Streptomyces sp. DH37]|uniref:WXG100 family type VII secretion target n=1 Tax=Streptomyces sp. DH37 TaxID=3040122 RepID=UPI00244193C4|nr:hypothetical protein [Streptomyces sp. DH37]MDG9706387.1 hypothetical protein [Streptomyces sp. DH37]
MATGEFEGKSLPALNAMVAKADPGLLTSRGNALGKAGSDMDGIGSELRAYIDRVEWEGEGGDAFREWGRQFALEAMRFGAYVRALGQHMTNAGQALTETKAAMPESEEMCYADPEKDKARREREEEKRQEAINQLNRLSSYYRTAGEGIRAEEEPDFKPLPNGKQHEGSGTGTSSTVPGSGSAPSAAPRSDSGAIAAHREGSAAFDRPGIGRGGTELRSFPVDDPSAPVSERPTNTRLDSVAPLPVVEHRPQSTASAPLQQSVGPSSPSVLPVAPIGPIQRTGHAPPHTAAGGRPTVGGGSGGTPPRGPVRDGITGGTPRQTGSPSSGGGAPRGPVAGGDRAPMGRPAGSYPGAVGGGAPASRGMFPGRPTASSPSGPMGGTRTGNGRGGTSFTPGGTGLVRGDTTPGTAGRPTSTNPPPESRRRDQDRPDYLAEDEETWAGRRDVVPPVID